MVLPLTGICSISKAKRKRIMSVESESVHLHLLVRRSFSLFQVRLSVLSVKNEMPSVVCLMVVRSPAAWKSRCCGWSGQHVWVVGISPSHELFTRSYYIALSFPASRHVSQDEVSPQGPGSIGQHEDTFPTSVQADGVWEGRR